MVTDRDALVCDLAETYGILDMEGVPVGTLATLAAGLRADSRIKMKLSGQKVPQRDLMLAAAVDRLAMLVWLNSEDGRKGINRPGSLVKAMTGEADKPSEVRGFDSPVDFELEWAKITGVGHG